MDWIDKTYTASSKPSYYWFICDTWVMTKRSMLHISRNIDQVLGLTIQPVMFMLLFYYVFGGAIQTEGNYLDFLMAGVFVQSLAFGALYASLSVATDLQRKIVDRFKTLPIAGISAIIGHVLADVVRNLIQGIILISVGFSLGFSPEASFSDWMLIILISVLFTFAISWLGAILGLLVKTIESVNWLGFVIIFPLTFVSSGFVPPETMPYALGLFAKNQPISHVIEAIRALMLGTDARYNIIMAFVWCLLMIVLFVPVAGLLFKKHGRE